MLSAISRKKQPARATAKQLEKINNERNKDLSKINTLNKEAILYSIKYRMAIIANGLKDKKEIAKLIKFYNTLTHMKKKDDIRNAANVFLGNYELPTLGNFKATEISEIREAKKPEVIVKPPMPNRPAPNLYKKLPDDFKKYLNWADEKYNLADQIIDHYETAKLYKTIIDDALIETGVDLSGIRFGRSFEPEEFARILIDRPDEKPIKTLTIAPLFGKEAKEFAHEVKRWSGKYNMTDAIKVFNELKLDEHDDPRKFAQGFVDAVLSRYLVNVTEEDEDKVIQRYRPIAKDIIQSMSLIKEQIKKIYDTGKYPTGEEFFK